MGQRLSYTYEAQWITEGAIWRLPDSITLRDEAGQPLGNSVMATMLMKIYDATGGANAIINNVNGTVSVLNARSCTLSAAGVFVLTLLPADTAILVASHAHEVRRVLVAYTWPQPTPTKSDVLEITVVIRNVTAYPFVAP